jgi:hypothetical protein
MKETIYQSSVQQIDTSKGFAIMVHLTKLNN